MEPINEQQSSKPVKSTTFKLSADDLRNQVENYNTLPITKSYRGISFLLICFSVFITTLFFAFSDLINFATLIAVFVIYIPLALFIFRGHKWALAAAALVWTLDKGLQVVNTFNIAILLWWVVHISYFYKAYQVEIARTKKPKLDSVGEPLEQSPIQ